MQFISPEFIFFLALAFCCFHFLPLALRKYYLLGISYLFYSFWSLHYAFLLLGVTALIFQAGKKIEDAASEKEKRKVAAGVVILLVLLLGFFKYLAPVFERLSWSLPQFRGWEEHGIFPILAPIGISYYTFKLISYCIDVYWQRSAAEKDFVSFAAYVAFFPQILSGPIQRSESFLPQIHNPQPVSYGMLTSGMRLLLFGFFKKLVIADRLAILVNGVYGNPTAFNSPTLVLAAYAYVFQLYADFSGLTDIARGTARLFGIQSPINFNLPFWAPNIQQYWRRWHMTLTQWLGDYVFNPLHMAFREWGKAGLILALMANMILIGFWHGANYTFLTFGVLHGIFMVVSVLTLKKRDQFFKQHPKLAFWRIFWAPLGMFQLVALAAIFFRADTMTQAWSVIRNILALNFSKADASFFGATETMIAVLGIAIMEAGHFIESRKFLSPVLMKRPPALRWAAYYALASGILIFGQFSAQSFIYFKF